MHGPGSGGTIRCLRLGLAAALLAALSSCGRFGYELSAEPQDSVPFDGLSPVSSAPRGDGGLLSRDSGGDPSPGFVPEREPFGDERFDNGPFDGHRPPRHLQPSPDSDGGNTHDGGVPAAPVGACSLLGTEQVVSGFDSPPGGLQALGPGNPTLTWTNAVGTPDLGALDFRGPSGGGEVSYSGALGDLRARPVSLNVQVVSGGSVRVRLFAESGAMLRRAQGAYTSPPLAQWDCVRLDPSAPAAAESGFDAADVVGLGLEIEGSGSVQVYLDQIAY